MFKYFILLFRFLVYRMLLAPSAVPLKLELPIHGLPVLVKRVVRVLAVRAAEPY